MFVDAARLPSTMAAVAIFALASACAKSEKTPPPPAEPAPATSTAESRSPTRDRTAPDASSSPPGAEASPTFGPLTNTGQCSAIRIHKAWHFHGYSTVAPGDRGELVAIHLTHHERGGFGFWLLDANGKRFDTDTQLVRVDASGAPLDRFDVGIEAFESPVDLVVIGAVTKGTRKMKFALRDGRRMFAPPTCAIDLDVIDGPAWPAQPSIDIVRFATTGPKRYLALVRVKGLLPEEWPAPQLQIVKNAARTEAARGEARAIARVDAQGTLLASISPSAERYLAAEYEWHPDGTPAEWVSWIADARPLPPPTAWPVSDELRTALDESAETNARDGRPAAAMKAFGAAPKR
ncbi:hypothetical protein [Labilithrix luteola]|nr:hypothetical protein [Labilithrix luteola]